MIWKINFYLMLLPCLLSAADERLDISQFNQQGLSNWEEKSFVDYTSYSLTQASQTTVLKAETSASASALIHEIEVDLNQTPFLNWSWKVDNIYQGNDERSKEGDDYPARLYVVISGGMWFWKTRAINYVWSSNQAIGATWDNAYTGNAKMVAQRSGDEETGNWVTEKRNVREDIKQLLGEQITTVHAIAIMTDSDNTKQQATAYYKDIYFSAE
ncbi:hypothetical protein MNBD_GAMMA26-1216 [hydrothermal vent metagenome]|uniref:DUF3047 domain-containing protein n=1 Tax=hydrothermal vent metagenome TaxID=652676 RepID=A0A3B1BEF9_9ZZZZ